VQRLLEVRVLREMLFHSSSLSLADNPCARFRKRPWSRPSCTRSSVSPRRPLRGP
jgi:hypothetical protein